MMFQTLTNQLGEIKFRKNLVRQHTSNIIHFPSVPNQDEIITILHQRNLATTQVMRKLLSLHIPLSPFLEIGAEKGQRSLLLVNYFQASGFALDISLDSLISMSYFAKKLGLRKLPIRICADAYHLPFTNNALPFIFCFETLHHFPTPIPITKEIYRVTQSHFYFGEEPIKQLLTLSLWRRDYNLNPFEKLLKLLFLLPFLSTIGKSETQHNILENAFWLDTWDKALKIFPSSAVTLQPIFWGPSSTNVTPNFFIKLLLAIQGGGISAICAKKTNAKYRNTSPILNLLACPTCHSHLNLAKLVCPRCKQKFVKKHGVYLLLPEDRRKLLYGF